MAWMQFKLNKKIGRTRQTYLMDTTYGNQGPYFSVDESVRHMAGSPLEPFALPVPVDERPHDEMLLRFSPILHLNDTGKSMSEPTLDSRATSTVVSPASQSYARRNSRFAAKKKRWLYSIFSKGPVSWCNAYEIRTFHTHEFPHAASLVIPTLLIFSHFSFPYTDRSFSTMIQSSSQPTAVLSRRLHRETVPFHRTPSFHL